MWHDCPPMVAPLCAQRFEELPRSIFVSVALFSRAPLTLKWACFSLAANDSQVLVLAAQPNGSLTIVEATRNITVSNTTRADNLEIGVCLASPISLPVNFNLPYLFLRLSRLSQPRLLSLVPLPPLPLRSRNFRVLSVLLMGQTLSCFNCWT